MWRWERWEGREGQEELDGSGTQQFFLPSFVPFQITGSLCPQGLGVVTDG